MPSSPYATASKPDDIRGIMISPYSGGSCAPPPDQARACPSKPVPASHTVGMPTCRMPKRPSEDRWRFPGAAYRQF